MWAHQKLLIGKWGGAVVDTASAHPPAAVWTASKWLSTVPFPRKLASVEW